jgi:hypothetical protein
MATKANSTGSVETPVEIPAAPTLYVVVEAFIADENGAPLLYEKGKVVPGTDRHVTRMPGRFRPVGMGRNISLPEVRS